MGEGNKRKSAVYSNWKNVWAREKENVLRIKSDVLTRLEGFYIYIYSVPGMVDLRLKAEFFVFFSLLSWEKKTPELAIFFCKKLA